MILPFLVQLAVLVGAARLLAEVARRFGQPAVIGELLAGILIGPSVLGALAPGVEAALFPWLGPRLDAALVARLEEQARLLDAVAWLGMVLLLLVTGLETDVSRMRALGRPTALAAALGLVIPFAGGWLLAAGLPDSALAHPSQRTVFCAFMATAMTITAMPVIAKILLDLGLVKHTVGVVILGAAIVDDTIGWLALSVVSALASADGFNGAQLALVLGETALFLLACRVLVLPALTAALAFVHERRRLPGTDLVIIFVSGVGLAAVTEAIGIHAVFGAFVAGTVLRQALPGAADAASSPTHTSTSTSTSTEALRSIVQAIFAPLFFACVGLKVDLGRVESASIVLSVIAVAIATKVIGCASGAALGGLGARESLAIGVGMSARGAMGLVVALVGLSLGILDAEMYSVIVMMAMVTSLLAPPLLRLLLARAKGSTDRGSRERIARAEGSGGAEDSGDLAA